MITIDVESIFVTHYLNFTSLWLLEICLDLRSCYFLNQSAPIWLSLCRVSNSFSPEDFADEIVLPSVKLSSSDSLIKYIKSFIEILKIIGPSIDPWRTPDRSTWKTLCLFLHFVCAFFDTIWKLVLMLSFNKVTLTFIKQPTRQHGKDQVQLLVLMVSKYWLNMVLMVRKY